MVGSGQFGIRRVRLLCLLSNRFDGSRAVDGLLGAGDVGQPGSVGLAYDDSISRAKPWRGDEARNGGACIFRSPEGFFLLLLCPVEHVGGRDVG